MSIHVPPMTRRRFLAGSLLAGAGLLLPRRLWAAEVPVDPDRFVLLSDTHVWAKRTELFNKVLPAENLARACREITALNPRPAGIIICGDCAQLKGQPGDYAVLADVLGPVQACGIPIHFVMGNHDDRENLYAAFPDARPRGDLPVPGKHVAIVEAPRANWFLLDSLDKTNVTPGVLGPAQLEWLAAALDARADKPALVVAHHDPDRREKPSGMVDTDALFKVLLPRTHVKAYVFGHTHRWEVSWADGLHWINVPTTAWIFDPKPPRAWVDVWLRPGGARLILNALAKTHPAHAQTYDLWWRT
ncbi:MAG: metallophosphoesterase [Planctomycetes bacterium]|nr:metallophosphoesterase [Planctomycetota bacterium]